MGGFEAIKLMKESYKNHNIHNLVYGSFQKQIVENRQPMEFRSNIDTNLKTIERARLNNEN